GKHLHVAREDDEFDIERTQELELSGLGLGFGFWGDGDVMKRNAVTRRSLCERGVVGNDGDDVARVVAALPAEDEIVETVIEFRDEQRDARALLGAGHANFHAERFGELTESVGIAGGDVRGCGPLDALKEDALLGVAVLVGVQDVAAMFKDPTGGAGDQTGTVGTMKEG